ncbi:MAG: hypothetical protein FJX57_25210, partial [Alphaproteobacteria bacterium]|nr:hypothetical protein [Alphaproteobacteria bacterium]
MFRKPTVFVIGAGASKEYGLPLGDELKSGIAEDLSFYYGQGGVLETGNEAFRQLIQPLYVDNPKLLVPESRTLASILHARLSVDEALDFVGDNQRLVKVGKLGIAYQILQGERKSSLPSKPSVARAERTLQYLPDTWLTTFLSIALSGARQGDISSIFSNCPGGLGPTR